MKKLTVHDLLSQKGRRQLTQVYCSSAAEAAAGEAAGVDMVITAEHNDVKAIRAAAPNTFFTVGLIHGNYPTAAEALRAAFQAQRHGADAVYCGSGFGIVKALADEGVPVVGHVGYIPYKATWFGGPRAVGKTAEEALRLYERARAYEAAGAFAVEMELVPRRVAAEIARRVRLLVLSMGSGEGCDGQYLFATDLLGTNRGHVPRHAKVYRNLKVEYDRLQREMTAAFAEFRNDVAAGTYPAEPHVIAGDDREFEEFLRRMEAAEKRTAADGDPCA